MLIGTAVCLPLVIPVIVGEHLDELGQVAVEVSQDALGHARLRVLDVLLQRLAAKSWKRRCERKTSYSSAMLPFVAELRFHFPYIKVYRAPC